MPCNCFLQGIVTINNSLLSHLTRPFAGVKTNIYTYILILNYPFGIKPQFNSKMMRSQALPQSLQQPDFDSPPEKSLQFQFHPESKYKDFYSDLANILL